MTDMVTINARELKALQESGDWRFDRVRFRYIEAMARLAPEQREPVSRLVEQKVRKALLDYQTDFALAQEEAALIVARVAAHYPDSARTVQRLFDECAFKEVQRLETRLRRATNHGALSALTDRILHGGSTIDGPVNDFSFGDMLRRQEDEVVNGLVNPGHEKPGELKSVRRFRESLAKISAEKLVMQAMKDIPEDAGPLNPQMLVIRSLATMRDLSPQYLNRFVSYMDTLLWLEQAEQ